LHTENQLLLLSGSGLKVPVWLVVVVASYPSSSQASTHVEVELGCDNILLRIHIKPILIYIFENLNQTDTNNRKN
jgi:hypothetical protein